MSCRQSRLSKPMETLMDSRISDGAPLNLPDNARSFGLDSFMVLFRLFQRLVLLVVGSAYLYALILVNAISTPLAAFDQQEILDLRQGTMQKLIVHESPKPVSFPTLMTIGKEEEEFSNHFGPILVVNFWATWCAPCRKEMPSLDRLQKQFSEQDVKVIAIATGRNEIKKIQSFLESVNVDSLKVLLDPKLKASVALQVRGLPATIILNREGNEVARLVGDAEWDSQSATNIIQNLVDDI